jgi:phytol kinase
MLFGLVIAGFIYFVQFIDESYAILTLIAVVFVGIVIADAVDRGIKVPLFSYLIGKLERKDTFPGKGTIYFFISTLFCLAFFGSTITVIAIVMLAILDSVTTVAGINFGRKKILGNKTLEGTACGIGAGFVIMLFFTGPINALVLSAAAGITELVSPVDDNLTIPIVTCVLLWFLGVGAIL